MFAHNFNNIPSQSTRYLVGLFSLAWNLFKQIIFMSLSKFNGLEKTKVWRIRVTRLYELSFRWIFWMVFFFNLKIPKFDTHKKKRAWLLNLDFWHLKFALIDDSNTMVE